MFKKILVSFFILLIPILVYPVTKATQVESLAAGINYDGLPLESGYVYFYSVGTTTAKNIWSDSNKTTPLANPFQLDAQGRQEVYGDGRYRIVIKTDDLSTTVADYDDFFYNTADISNLFQIALNSGDGSYSDETLASAIVDAAGNTVDLYISAGNWVIDNNLTIPSNINLYFANGAYFTVSTGKIVSVIGSITAPIYQIFRGAGTVNLTNSRCPIQPKYWFDGSSVLVNINGNLTVTGNTNINGNLTVTGNTSINGNLTVTTINSNLTITGNTSIDGNLTVTGNTSINGNLTVTTINSNLTITGNTSIDGNLIVLQTVTANILSDGIASITTGTGSGFTTIAVSTLNIGNDTNLYSPSTNVLKTDDTFESPKALIGGFLDSVDYNLAYDANAKWEIISGINGTTSYGALGLGNNTTTAVDNDMLARLDCLQLNSGTNPNCGIKTSIVAYSQGSGGAANGYGGKLVLGTRPDNTAGIPIPGLTIDNTQKLWIGSTQDTNLYRDSANVLKTDDSLVIGNDNLTIDSTAINTNFTMRSTNANAFHYISGVKNTSTKIGHLAFGLNDTESLDGNNVHLKNSLNGNLNFFTNDTQALRIDNTGKLWFGSTIDTNLYRDSANVLKTDDNLIVGGDIKTVGWTDYSSTSTVSGFSSLADKEIFYKKVGNLVFIYYYINGTSNANNFTFTLPYNNNSVITIKSAIATAFDNGFQHLYPDQIILQNSSNIVYVQRLNSSTGWTATNQKSASGQFFYEAQ